LIYGLKAAFSPYVGPETRGVNLRESNIKAVNYVWERFAGSIAVSCQPCIQQQYLPQKKV
jgi:hypothetical protein